MLGIALGLLLLVALVLMPLSLRGSEVDGAERLSSYFAAGRPPWGFELTEAAKRPSGETVLRLARPEGQGPLTSADPEEIVLIEYGGRGALARLFRRPDDDENRRSSEKKVKWEEEPDFEWHSKVEFGEVEWGRWRADYAVERHFQEGGTWRDSVRVNLGQPGRLLALFAQWPVGQEHSPRRLRELLATIRLEAPPTSGE